MQAFRVSCWVYLTSKRRDPRPGRTGLMRVDATPFPPFLTHKDFNESTPLVCQSRSDLWKQSRGTRVQVGRALVKVDAAYTNGQNCRGTQLLQQCALTCADPG